MALNSFEIQQNKEEFINLLMKTNRPGIDTLISWLESKSDFFDAPSSTIYHGSYAGGLCQHSLNVYHALQKLISMANEMAINEKKADNIPEDTIIISALLHDLCKTNFYKKEVKVFKDEATSTWHHYYGYKCVDEFPIGHGEKSVIMAQNFIRLTGDEAVAIRWHMGMTDPGTFISPYGKSAYSTAANNSALVVLLQEADYFASYMMEPQCDPKVENLID